MTCPYNKVHGDFSCNSDRHLDLLHRRMGFRWFRDVGLVGRSSSEASERLGELPAPFFRCRIRSLSVPGVPLVFCFCFGVCSFVSVSGVSVPWFPLFCFGVCSFRLFGAG